MPGIGPIWQRSFKSLGLLVLALNVVLVSIPRCELILSFFLHHEQHELAHGDVMESCHHSDGPVDAQSPALTAERLCECSILSFMAFHAPALNLHEHVAFRIQSERLLIFPWKAFLSDFQPLPEPPYPKV
ncbi:hypothetical protein [Oligoflexus tunisiensis]|uniref:hypothetical protein n=1 Tax=Oligoflexus tunisiensis TaxID=708132 RepID=UPI00114CD00D|nr:hypothetical protein [Oligoflexus tunisiensis]